MAGYGDDALFDAWLDANGYNLPNTAPDIAVLRQRGSAYIDGAYGPRFPGYPTGGLAQDRAWPRTGATVFGSALASDLIPQRVIDASYMAAYLEATSPGSLTVVVDPAKRVKRQKVEGIEREFFEPGDSGSGTVSGPASSAIEGLLGPLLTAYAGEPAVLVV